MNIQDIRIHVLSGKPFFVEGTPDFYYKIIDYMCFQYFLGDSEPVNFCGKVQDEYNANFLNLRYFRFNMPQTTQLQYSYITCLGDTEKEETPPVTEPKRKPF